MKGHEGGVNAPRTGNIGTIYSPRSKRRIVFVNRFFYPDHSATSQLLSDLAFSLAAKGHDVRVVCSVKSYQGDRLGGPAIEMIRGVKVFRTWSPPFDGARLSGRALDYVSFYIFATLRLARLVRKGDVVVVMTDPPMFNVLAWITARTQRARVVDWVQDIFPEVAAELGFSFATGSVGRALKKVRDFALVRSDHVVAIGEAMKARLIALGVPREKTTVIHNWADGVIEAPPEKSVIELRNQWVGKGKFIVGYSGNLGRAHSCDALLEAAEALNERKDIVFLIVGGGVHYKRLQASVRNKGLRNVVFKEYQPREKLAAALRVPDVHLITLNPRLEGLIVPSKFYGIAAVGKPAIFIGASDGEIACLLKSSDCGVSVADGSQLAAEIMRLKENPEQLADMGSRAQKLYEQTYRLESAVEHWDDILDTVMAGGAAALSAKR